MFSGICGHSIVTLWNLNSKSPIVSILHYLPIILATMIKYVLANKCPTIHITRIPMEAYVIAKYIEDTVQF